MTSINKVLLTTSLYLFTFLMFQINKRTVYYCKGFYFIGFILFKFSGTRCHKLAEKSQVGFPFSSSFFLIKALKRLKMTHSHIFAFALHCLCFNGCCCCRCCRCCRCCWCCCCRRCRCCWCCCCRRCRCCCCRCCRWCRCCRPLKPSGFSSILFAALGFLLICC